MMGGGGGGGLVSSNFLCVLQNAVARSNHPPQMQQQQYYHSSLGIPQQHQAVVPQMALSNEASSSLDGQQNQNLQLDLIKTVLLSRQSNAANNAAVNQPTTAKGHQGLPAPTSNNYRIDNNNNNNNNNNFGTSEPVLLEQIKRKQAQAQDSGAAATACGISYQQQHYGMPSSFSSAGRNSGSLHHQHDIVSHLLESVRRQNQLSILQGNQGGVSSPLFGPFFGLLRGTTNQHQGGSSHQQTNVASLLSMLQQRQPPQYQQLQQSGGIDNGNPLVAPLRQLQDERQKGTLMCLINNQVMQSASPQTKATSTPTSNFVPLSAVETESAGSWYNVNRTTAADFALSQAERAITSGTSSSNDKLDATAHHAEKKRSPPKKRQPSFPSVSFLEGVTCPSIW